MCLCLCVCVCVHACVLYSGPGRPPVLKILNFSAVFISPGLKSLKYWVSAVQHYTEELKRKDWVQICRIPILHVVDTIKKTHANDGERLMIGHLRSRRIFVPRSRIQASIHRVDPVNTAIRRRVTIRRRVYYAEGPNSVWHIDGHHKLIQWRLVTHGGIDGYSRTVVYLRCAGNNRAVTVLHAFMDAVARHGIPEKVRSDLGGENTGVEVHG